MTIEIEPFFFVFVFVRSIHYGICMNACAWHTYWMRNLYSQFVYVFFCVMHFNLCNQQSTLLFAPSSSTCLLIIAKCMYWYVCAYCIWILFSLVWMFADCAYKPFLFGANATVKNSLMQLYTYTIQMQARERQHISVLLWEADRRMFILLLPVS